MKKKSFWRRTNRGFLVSMVLLAAVLLYVAITQIMLIPQRSTLRELGEKVSSLWESTMLSDAQLQELQQSEEKQEEFRNSFKSELAALFVDNSDYLDTATDSLLAYAVQEIQGEHRTTKRTLHKVKTESCNILEDTATVSMRFRYAINGDFFMYDGNEGSLQTCEGVDQLLFLELVCKRVDGEWKIYRISSLYDATDTMEGGY